MDATHARRERIGAVVAVVATVIGLAVSAVLLVDSVRPTPAFCAEGGCAAVRATGWAKPLGVPLPGLGLGFFALMLGLTLAGPRVATARAAIAGAGAVGAIGLLIVQGAVIGAWCQHCLIADGAAIALAAAVGLGRARAWPRRASSTWAFAAVVALVAVGVPLRGLRSAPGPVAIAAPTDGLPAPIAREQRVGVVTVVDFIDFECPFCRALHGRLVEAIAQAGVPVRVVRKMTPLLRIHAGALAAAIAWCCAERQGRADAMADALLAAPPSELTTSGCEQLAVGLGLDLARYRADAADPAIVARIDADLADARAAGARSLPTIYIGREAVIGGAATVDDLIASLRRAAT